MKDESIDGLIDQFQERLEFLVANMITEAQAAPISNGQPFKDPFKESSLIQRIDKPEPKQGEERFYYYYHRSTGRMILRVGSKSYILDAIDTKGLDTWTVRHTEPPLKYLVAGNARRVYVKGNIAILS
jgi:hypothetical protein